MQTAPPAGPVYDEFDQEQSDSDEDEPEPELAGDLAQEVPEAGRLLVPERPVDATHPANVRGSLEAGFNRVIQKHAANGQGKTMFGCRWRTRTRPRKS